TGEHYQGTRSAQPRRSALVVSPRKHRPMGDEIDAARTLDELFAARGPERGAKARWSAAADGFHHGLLRLSGSAAAALVFLPAAARTRLVATRLGRRDDRLLAHHTALL